MTGDNGLPAELKALLLLRERCPHLKWDSVRVVQACRDFATVDSMAAAARCADWINTHTRTRDGPSTLRTFHERIAEEQVLSQQRRLREAELAPYDTRRNL